MNKSSSYLMCYNKTELNIKRHLLLALCIFCLFQCSSPNSLEPEQKLDPEGEIENFIKVSGQIFLDSTSVSHQFIVKLQGDSLYKDTTDVNGKFNFIINSFGKYRLSISDSICYPIQTELNILNDTTLNIYLEALSTDFIPLKINNWWSYKFEFYHFACFPLDEWEEGLLTWKVLNEETENNNLIFTIEENINGIKMVWPPDGDIDTTYINQSDTISFVYKSNDYIEMGKGSYLSKLLTVEIKRHHNIYQKEFFIDSNFSSINDSDTNIVIKNLDSGHKILLRSDVGILNWEIKNLSNCSPKGNLILNEYYISK